MAVSPMRITDECINCGACEPECPHEAIAEGPDRYAIDEARCDGCPGTEPQCLAVCPVECIVPREVAAPAPAAPVPADDGKQADSAVASESASTADGVDPPLLNPLRVTWQLWAALIGSTLVQLAVAALFAGTTDPPRMLLPILACLAALMASASLLLPRRVLRTALLGLELPIDDQPDLNAERAYRQAPPTLRRFADPEAALRCAAGALNASMVLGLAAAEGIVLLGMVLRLLGTSWPPVSAFFLASWLLMIPHLPSMERLRDALEQAYRARL